MGAETGFRAGYPFAWATSTRSCGNMSFSSGETSGSSGNRERFLAPLGIGPQDLVMPRQVHGSRIQLCDNTHRGMGGIRALPGIADTDALVTRERGLAIGVMTADCMPVFLFDPKTPAVAIVHAGWRGTAARICALTVERMRGEFGSDPSDIRCLMGPSIRPCCYAVGGEMRDVFPDSVRTVDGSLRLDLGRENRRQLTAAGVPETNIFDMRHCTCCAPEGYFSFRKEKETCGRMLSVIMLL